MYGIKRILIAVMAVAVIASSPMTVYAVEYSPVERADIAGDLLKDIMKLILEEYVGGSVTPEQLYEAAVRGITDALDPYSEYFSRKELEQFTQNLTGYTSDIGITLQILKNGDVQIIGVLLNSPAESAGLALGDILLTVNGSSVAGMSENQIHMLLAEAGVGEIEFTIGRESGTESIMITQQDRKKETVHVSDFGSVLEYASTYDNSGIKYIKIDIIGEETANELAEVIGRLREEGISGIVLDMRNNPGGYMNVAVDICSMLVPAGPIMYTIDAKDHYIVINSTLEELPFQDIIVVTDKGTASASEIIVSALQDADAAVIVGETTYGKGVIQTLYTMALGGSLKLTTEEYFRRNGEKINKIGIEPDIKVSMPDLIKREITLDENNSANEVHKVKNLLNFIGYEVGSDDDIYDDKTMESITQFQTDMGLPVTGGLEYDTLYGLNLTVYAAYQSMDLPLRKAYELLREMTE